MNSYHCTAERLRITNRARGSMIGPICRLVGIGLKKDSRVLEIGCGPGVHTAALAAWLTDGQITGIEPDYNFMLEAKARIRVNNLTNAQIRRGNAESLPFDNDSFDFVYSRLVFQHLTKPLIALKEIRRVLTEGGGCLIEDIDRGWFMSWPEPNEVRAIWKRIEHGQSKSGGDPFIGRKLSQLFNQAGMRNISTNIETHQLDGAEIRGFVHDTGESLLEYIDQPQQNRDRLVLSDWADFTASEPHQHNLYLGWFTATGIK